MYQSIYDYSHSIIVVHMKTEFGRIRIADGLITTPQLTHPLVEFVCIDFLHHSSSFLKKSSFIPRRYGSLSMKNSQPKIKLSSLIKALSTLKFHLNQSITTHTDRQTAAIT